ncbi:MAG TPA: orotidine-5'-phosphate decarboxylase [Solirubrobacterales bacterium]|nr:orotidine-5'-phosphate decarboxylase [Solirubrobacterales bacterium]
MTPFADRLAALVEERRSQICLGLDPDPAKLAGEGLAAPGPGALAAELAAAAVVTHCRTLIERAGPSCVAVKPQLACFERLGAPGWAALAEVCAAAREAGLLTIADGKRGDVPVTAAAYAQSLVGVTPTSWGPVAGLGADAFTANPLLGLDALEPLLAAAEDANAGVFVLVRTSNRGASDVQDLPAPHQPLHERLARLVDGLSGRLAGGNGLSAVGAVVGATEPLHIARLRELMPHSIFLLPGVGAQGGKPELLGAAFVGGRSSALVAVSRGIADDPDPAAAAERLRAAVWDVSTA